MSVYVPSLPDIRYLVDLEHANWTLTFVQASMMAQKTEDYLHFRLWLEQWQRTFSELLYRESGGLKLEDMIQAKALKAQHERTYTLEGRDLFRHQHAEVRPEVQAYRLRMYWAAPGVDIPSWRLAQNVV
ncbi:hypothetical protein LTR17_013750 [Elasticomyces elasticus]|nr:hypothetical protein LTR17_013750 [Elasticomyces elasticus]